MSTPKPRSMAVGLTLLALLCAAGGWAQTPPAATLSPAGMISVAAGEAEPVTLELSAHGPNWQHAPQDSATGATTSALADEPGTVVSGTLPIPNTEGGALGYTETLRPLPQGLRVEYEVGVATTMTLWGLQVSVYLPVSRYGDAEILVTSPDADPQTVGLPAKQDDQRFQLWYGQGARLEVARGTDQAFTVELQAATDVVVQDLRQWEHPVYEIRFPAIMEGGGQEVTPEDRFHLDLSLTFPAAVELPAPATP